MTAAEWIAKRRELLAAASEGPWSAADEHDGFDFPAWCVSQMRPGWESMTPTAGYVGDVADVEREPDAKLIADARTSLPRALDALEAALELAKGHRDWVTKRGRDDCICTICDMCRAIETALRAES